MKLIQNFFYQSELSPNQVAENMMVPSRQPKANNYKLRASQSSEDEKHYFITSVFEDNTTSLTSSKEHKAFLCCLDS